MKVFQQAGLCLVIKAAFLAAAVVLSAGAHAEGLRQSPVDIQVDTAVKATADLPIVPNLAAAATLEVLNTFNATGTVEQEWATLKAEVPAGSYVEVDGRKYHLLQFHFHAPSEHTVNGAHTAMEVHFVFLLEGSAPCGRSPDALLVIGARIESGASNVELGKIFDQPKLPENSAAAHLTVANFNLGNVLGSLKGSWRYSGSLTAPAAFPSCVEPEGDVEHQLASETLPENVSWVVLSDTITMSPTQIDAFRKLFPHDNTRKTRPLDKRLLTIFQ